MSFTHNVCFVAQVSLGDGSTYYLCSSSRVAGFDMDGNTYQPFILSIGDSEKVGNFGEGSAIGNTSMTLLLGQKQYQGVYNLDIKKPWNNGSCTIKIRDIDSITAWAGCENYATGLIKNFKISNDKLDFTIEDINSKDLKVIPSTTVEDIVSLNPTINISDIPKDSVDKKIPLQFGTLTDVDNGTFAKGLLISEKIGSQEVYFDTTALNSIDNIGIWETGSKRYFTGKADSEYSFSDDNNYIKFSVDTTTTLDGAILETSGQDTIVVADYTKIIWVDESDFEDIDVIPEVLSVNIIAIDSELMLITEKPESNTIYVERGFSGSTPAAHDSGSAIFQSARYSAKNLLPFSETFLPRAVSNHYQNLNRSTYDQITDGSWNDFLSPDNSKYVLFQNRPVYSLGFPWTTINFDLEFGNINEDYTCTGAYFILKIDVACDDNTDGGAVAYTNADVKIMLVSTGVTSPDNFVTTTDEQPVRNMVMFLNSPLGSVTTASVDFVSNPVREVTMGSNYVYAPDIKKANSVAESGSLPNYQTPSNTTIRPYEWQSIPFNTISYLNKKWKLVLNRQVPEDGNTGFIKLYQAGFLLDFFTTFNDKRLCGKLTGQMKTTATDTIFDTAASGTLSINPWHSIAILLTSECGYSATDFDYTSWRAIVDYYSNSSITENQLFNMSYGINESEKGWDLCQLLCSHHGMMLTKTNEGKIKLINLYALQKKTSYGYLGMPTYGISIDDIVNSGGKRAISIQQTGTDRIRNVVKVKYNRNNSTDEYQAVYPPVQSDADSFVLTESGKTVAEARTTYYNGQKTETLEIEAFSITDETTASLLWRWHINDKAEVFFYVTLTIPYYHYADINSKSSQYDIGDLIYLDGIYQGVTFNSTHKWVIRNLTKTDQGKEIVIEAKSIQPVSEF